MTPSWAKPAGRGPKDESAPADVQGPRLVSDRSKPDPKGSSPAGAGARQGEPAADRTLDSWKEIADFLGVSVRTAHRWRDSASMPVHRTPSGHVYADAAELAEWRRGRPFPSRRGLALWGGLAFGGALLLGLLYLWAGRSAGAPVSVRFEGPQVVAIDRDGRARWTSTIPDFGYSGEWGWQVSTPDRFLVADVDGDGDTEVLVNVIPDTLQDKPGRLVCYSEDGGVRWEFVLGRRVKDRFGEYSQDYLGHILRAVRVGGRPYVLSIATHRRWHPTQAVLLEPRTGGVVEQFWHPGAISHAMLIDPDRDGASDLLLAGVNNPGGSPGYPTAMTLRLPFSLVPPVAESVMGDLSDGGPRAYAVLPRPDVSMALGHWATVKRVAFEEPGTILIHARYGSVGHTALSYRFDLDIRLLDMYETMDASGVHDTLWRSKVLSHPYSAEEGKWLRGVRRFQHVPDGSAELIPPFRPRS